MVILVVATRDGQLEGIAAYGAGVSVVSIAGVVIGGGTTLTFVNGDLDTQRSVRQWRIRVIAPLLVVVGLLATAAYGGLTTIAPADVALGSAAAAINNLSEIESGFLKRRLRTPHITSADIVSRALGIAVMVAGGSFAMTMACVAAVRYGILTLFSLDDPSRRVQLTRPLRAHMNRALRPELAGVSVLYAVLDRLPFLVAPIAVPPTSAGSIAALFNAQQAVAGVLVTGAQTTMAARAESSSHVGWANRFEALTIGAGAATGGLGLWQSEVLLKFLHVDAVPGIHLSWAILCITIPIGVAGRVLLFRAIARGAERHAFFGIAAGASAAFIAAIAAVLVQDELPILAAIGLSGELVTFLVLLALRLGPPKANCRPLVDCR